MNRSKHATESNKKRKKEGVYFCDRCNKVFISNTSLIAHKSYCSHSIELATCNVCKKQFSSKRGLKIHKSLVHCNNEIKQKRHKKISKKAINRRFANVSLEEMNFFKSLQTIFKDVIHSFQIKTDSHKYDFYIPSLNLIIEFDGDYWHGNKDNVNLTNRMKQQRRIDESFTNYAITNGFDIIRV